MTPIPGSVSGEVESIRETAMELISRSWAESFFGNISILLDDAMANLEVKERFPSPVKENELEGKTILATRTTSTMEEVVDDPEGSLGLYRIEGDSLELVWGEGPPTSEISSHLMAYTSSRGRCILHCHMDCISGVCDESIDIPEGCCIVDEMEPGSLPLAEATRNAFQKCDTVIWKGHGAITIADDLVKCLQRLIRLEQYLKEPAG